MSGMWWIFCDLGIREAEKRRSGEAERRERRERRTPKLRFSVTQSGETERRRDGVAKTRRREDGVLRLRFLVTPLLRS